MVCTDAIRSLLCLLFTIRNQVSKEFCCSRSRLSVSSVLSREGDLSLEGGDANRHRGYTAICMRVRSPAHAVSCARATSLLAALILLQLPTFSTGGTEAVRVPVGGGWSGGRGGGVDGAGGGTGGGVEQSRLFESEKVCQDFFEKGL